VQTTLGDGIEGDGVATVLVEAVAVVLVVGGARAVAAGLLLLRAVGFAAAPTCARLVGLESGARPRLPVTRLRFVPGDGAAEGPAGGCAGNGTEQRVRTLSAAGAPVLLAVSKVEKGSAGAGFLVAGGFCDNRCGSVSSSSSTTCRFDEGWSLAVVAADTDATRRVRFKLSRADFPIVASPYYFILTDSFVYSVFPHSRRISQLCENLRVVIFGV
jgi:hypothetical protein